MLPQATERKEVRGETSGTDPSLAPLQGLWLCQPLDLRLLNSRMMRGQISIVQATQAVVLHYSNPKKINAISSFFIQTTQLSDVYIVLHLFIDCLHQELSPQRRQKELYSLICVRVSVCLSLYLSIHISVFPEPQTLPTAQTYSLNICRMNK